MQRIILNSDGSSIWADPNEKLLAVQKSLESSLETISRKIDANDHAMYPRKLNFNTYITTLLLNTLSVYPNISFNDATAIDINTLKEYIKAFRQLVNWILGFYQDYVCTKEQFNAFCGFSYAVYNALLLNENPEIVAELERLEGFFGELQLISAQTGMVKEKTTETRLRSDGIGHGMNLKNEDDKKQTINVISYDAESVAKTLTNMGIKFIDNKKKS